MKKDKRNFVVTVIFAVYVICLFFTPYICKHTDPTQGEINVIKKIANTIFDEGIGKFDEADIINIRLSNRNELNISQINKVLSEGVTKCNFDVNVKLRIQNYDIDVTNNKVVITRPGISVNSQKREIGCKIAFTKNYGSVGYKIIFSNIEYVAYAFLLWINVLVISFLIIAFVLMIYTIINCIKK